MVVFLGGGGLTEQVTHPARAVYPVPDGVSAATAAAIPINYCTTLYALHDRGTAARGRIRVDHRRCRRNRHRGDSARERRWSDHDRRRRWSREERRWLAAVGADVVIDHQATPDWVDLVREAERQAASTSPMTRWAATRSIRCVAAWDGTAACS